MAGELKIVGEIGLVKPDGYSHKNQHSHTYRTVGIYSTIN